LPQVKGGTRRQKSERGHGLRVSTSDKASCYDRVAVLRRKNSAPDCLLILLAFFKTLKAELI